MTQKAESNVTMGAERKTWRCYKVLALETEEMSQERNVPLEAGKGKEAHAPRDPPGGAQPSWRTSCGPVKLTSNSWPPEPPQKNLRCFKLPSSWQFVTEATGSIYPVKRKKRQAKAGRRYLQTICQTKVYYLENVKNSKKMQQPNNPLSKNGQKIFTDFTLKSTYKWQISAWKHVHIISH